MKKILITPLDWGLGHATRCIPIIRYLLSRQCLVFIASSGSALKLLKAEFPELIFFNLSAYAPVYSNGRSMVWQMVLQLPKFIYTIRREHGEVQKIIHENKIDILISDNRYGCWSSTIPSVFITHQSNILMPKRFGWLSPWIRRANKLLINKFTYWWIPDYPADDSLAGLLIDFEKKPYSKKSMFIGALSRFNFQRSFKVYDVVAICSGPEPQRTLLEKLLLEQLNHSGLKFVLVRGVIETQTEWKTSAKGQVVNFLTSDALQQLLPEAEMIIARSGYSTVMDMQVLQKKVIFIPTPGQTEQEYLARRLKDKGVVFFMHQNEFTLSVALDKSKQFSGFSNKQINQHNLLFQAFDLLKVEDVTLNE